MSEETVKQGRWARFLERSREDYQLVVRNNQNYNEVGSYNLTPLNIYVALSTLIVVVAIAVFLLIAYTPLRKYIPGYADVVQRQEVNELRETLRTMEEKMTAQTVYLDNFRRTLTGEATTAEDIEQQSPTVDGEEVEAVTLSEEEVQLRREMELERIGNRNRLAGGEEATPRPGSPTRPLAEMNLTAPVNGEISSGFLSKPDHLGVDILAAQNTAIKSTAPGVVFLSEFTPENGNVIGIQHDNDLVSFYKHNSKLLKAVGDRVRAGEAVAIIGNTGTQTTGPHLHFELWHRQRAVDPGEYVRF